MQPGSGCPGKSLKGSGLANPATVNLKGDLDPERSGELADSTLTRKTSMEASWMTVPQTDTGRWVEDTKANG